MRRVLAILVPTAMLVGLGLSTVASAHGGGEHLHFIAKATGFEKADLGDKGKQVVVAFDVFEHHHDGSGSEVSAQDHEGEERAGHGTATCVTADFNEGALCSSSIELEDGQLSSAGLIHMHHQAAGQNGDHGSITVPVTGGSGQFSGAAGELEISHAEGDAGGADHAAASAAASPADHNGHMGGHAIHLTFHLE